MSYAIFDLELEAPPITVHRITRSDGTRWVAICTVCGRRTRPRPLLSAAMRDQHRHGREHYREMLNRAVSTDAVPSVHRLTVHSTRFRRPMPVDAVHLSEPRQKRRVVA